MKVKFYYAGGHSAGRAMTDDPGIAMTVKPERYERIKNDGPDVLRSPFRGLPKDAGSLPVPMELAA